jgi:hypothetical protein
MKTTNLLRVMVYGALIAWPTVESYRLYAAKQDLASRQQVEAKVTQRLAMTRQKTQMANAQPNKR